MTVSPTEGIDSGLMAMANAATSSSPTATGASDDQDMYLQLMVAQMKYQDPMNPVSTTDMLSQNAQFEALTQMQDINKETNQLLSAQLSFGAMGMLGNTVSYVGADGTALTGTPSAVAFTSNGPLLTIDGQTVPVSSITGVTTTATNNQE